jgi:phage major head subunit gpT-like protein
MVITNATLQALRVRFGNDYQKGYQKVAATWYDKVSSTIPSDGTSNVYGWMAELPEMRLWEEGERLAANIKEYAYTLLNKRYELTYKIKRDDIKDDKLAVYTQHFTQLGMRTRKHPDILMRDNLNNGQNSPILYTGQPFFSTSHLIDPFNAGLGTYQNYWSSGMPLTAANFEYVRGQMMLYKGESGTPLGILPNLLVVPPTLEMQARRIVKSSMIPAASGVAAPETNVLEGAAEIVVAYDLQAFPNAWYLMDTTRGIYPFVYQLREASEFAMIMGATDLPVFERNEYQFGSTIRDAAGYTLPFLCAKASA